MNTGNLSLLLIHDLFKIVASKNKEKIAIVSEVSSLSYCELDLLSNQLANYLLSLGVGPELLIGIGLGRSVEYVIASLAILKSGAAFFPLDPANPETRRTYILQDTRSKFFITILKHTSTRNSLDGVKR